MDDRPEPLTPRDVAVVAAMFTCGVLCAMAGVMILLAVVRLVTGEAP